MYFFSVFCIFATAFVTVQCHHHKKHMDFTMAEKTDCLKHRVGIMNTVVSSTCKPHYRHVPLKPMPLQEFRPSIVSVKRCDGHCPGNTCMPTKTQTIKVPVKLVHSDPDIGVSDTCAFAEVEEHIHCKCMCKQKEEDCNERQYFMKSHCACACLNGDLNKELCESKMGMVWDDDDCTCNCTEMIIECTSGLKWNRDQCKCM